MMKTRLSQTVRRWLIVLGLVAVGGSLWLAGGGGKSGRLDSSAKRAETLLSRGAVADAAAAVSRQAREQDIAAVNLRCATGLPGAEGLDVAACLATLDQWADRVKAETERHFYRFRARPAEYEHSEGYFRMLMMAVVVYEDCGVRYNPVRVTLPSPGAAPDGFFADSRDLFLHGLLAGRRLGTCSSLPVLYVALGRRLGYPLQLVTTKAHLFLRWEDGRERFNLEATGKGMNRYDDTHFKQWPFPVTDAECRVEGYLKSLTGAEERAVFLSLRGNCLKAGGRLAEAAASYAAAVRAAPEWPAFRALLAATQNGGGAGMAAGPVMPLQMRRQAATVGGPGPAVIPADPNPLREIR